MAALQQAVSRADVDARVAALFATIAPDARGPAAPPKDQALADLLRLRSCSRALASAWLTVRSGFTELTAIEIYVNARLRLGEILLASQDGDAACVCGRLMPAGGTHSLICGALWRIVVARHCPAQWRHPGAGPSPDVVSPVPLSRMCNNCHRFRATSSNARPVFRPASLARKPPPAALTLCRYAHTPSHDDVNPQSAHASAVPPHLPPMAPKLTPILPSRRTPQ